ncbi:MAG: hypothetical protein LBF74_08130, partial [Treponema sp.]|nr:hypothetical protein [Treponema sp.]
YTAGTSDYEGVYYKKITDDSVKFANAYDSSQETNIQDLAAAIDKFSQANESALVNWEYVAAQTRQPSTAE